MGNNTNWLSVFREQENRSFQVSGWEGSFEQYLELVQRSPNALLSAYQRLYSMILSYGVEELDDSSALKRYKFFHHSSFSEKDRIFGLDLSIMRLVQVLKSASCNYGSEKRVLLLHGPVGSAKSTIVRLLKRGLEEYSRKEEGALYTFRWELSDGESFPCPMNEEPLRLIPELFRSKILDSINEHQSEETKISISGGLCPSCRYHFSELLKENQGDWTRILDRVRVYRFFLSEEDRSGIGTFQPKDEKNQDSTELTGDINYRKIALYGSDSDPRAFNFDGEFNVANRGLIEFIEVLKLEVAFLYDLLSASQEHKIKPKKFAQTTIDEVIIGHTNEPEYRRLQNNEFMEALRDRTIKIDVPYITRLDDEIQIYKKDYPQSWVGKKHIAPHTIEIASLWAVLTRLETPKKAQLTVLQKLKLYNGKSLPGFSEDSIRELKKEAKREGMEGISPRYIQDKISNALVSDIDENCLNPFMVLHELEDGLLHHSLISKEEQRSRYRELLNIAKSEYEDRVKNEVQRAISSDDEAISHLCSNYIDNIKAYTQKEKVKNKYTGEAEEPNERLMRSIEEKIDIPESRKDDFRREIMNYIGALALEGKIFHYKTNERLQKALELKLFEDQKDSIQLTSLISKVVDKETQEKIEVVKNRLIENYNYCEVCANDVLNFVASIFARGDIQNREG